MKVAVVTRDYREATEFDDHPVRVVQLLVRTDLALDDAVLEALSRAGELIPYGADSVAVFLAHVREESHIANHNLHRIDASVRDGFVSWNEYEWTSNGVTLDDVSRAREQGLYPPHFVDLAVFPIVDSGWGEAGVAGAHEIGLWVAEHGVGVATWFGQTLADNILALGVGGLALRGARARRMRRAVARWRERNTDSPRVLRAIVDRRSSWDIDRLARLMGLHRTEARQLLRSLGYGKSRDGLWRRKDGRKALARRAAWIADEIEV